MTSKTKETYVQARKRLHQQLATEGYTLSAPTLKVLWADPKHAPREDTSGRVWFHAQAVYLGAHSLFLDIRGMAIEKFLFEIRQAHYVRSHGA